MTEDEDEDKDDDEDEDEAVVLQKKSALRGPKIREALQTGKRVITCRSPTGTNPAPFCALDREVFPQKNFGPPGV